MSTFLGILKEYPRLSVDYFRDKALEPNIGAYFLSHCHTDHMHGLKNPAFEKRLKAGGTKNPKIYLSKISQIFLENDPKYKHLKPYMMAVTVNEPITVTLYSRNPEENIEVIVTLLQAGHCPGSVMLLFEGQNGRVLYTGDFRLTMSDLDSTSFLLDELGEKKKIDNLYIDTTFCKPDAFYIPDRNDSLTAALQIIKPWLENNCNYVRIICSAQYGYERFFIGLNENLDVKIHVNDSKFRRYDGIPEIQEALTILPHETRIHACTWHKTESDDDNVEDVYGTYKLPCGFKSDHQMRVLHIKLSAMWYAQNVGITEISCKTDACNFYRVCYSMHSSLQELRDFVTYTKPITITPNVVPKGVDSSTLVKWLRNPMLKPEQFGLDSQSPPQLGLLKLPMLTKSLDRNDTTSPGKTGFNSSQESKENYESELDLSGCEDIGSVYIKTPPAHNPDSPQWCFELTPEKDTLRVPSRLSEISDCAVESPFKLNLISALSSTAESRGIDSAKTPILSQTSITDDESFQATQNYEPSQKLKLSLIGDNGKLPETQNLELSQNSEVKSFEDNDNLQDTQNFELSQKSDISSIGDNCNLQETQNLELSGESELSSIGNHMTQNFDLSQKSEVSSVGDDSNVQETQKLKSSMESELSSIGDSNNRVTDLISISDNIVLEDTQNLELLSKISELISTAENEKVRATQNMKVDKGHSDSKETLEELPFPIMGNDNGGLDVSCNVALSEGSTTGNVVDLGQTLTLNSNTGNYGLDVSRSVELCEVSMTRSCKTVANKVKEPCRLSTLISIASKLETAPDMPDLEMFTQISNDVSEKRIVGETPVIENINNNDISMGESQQQEICNEEDEEDSARGLTSSDTSSTSDGSSSDKSLAKIDVINLGLSEYPSDSGSWSEDSRAPASFSNEKRAHIEDSKLALSCKRVKYSDADPFMSNYSRQVLERKCDIRDNNGITAGSPELFSNDSDESVVECGDSNEEYATNSDSDKSGLAPVRARSFEVVDLTSSESRLNGSSSSTSSSLEENQTTSSCKAFREIDSDATPDKIVTQDGEVLYPINRVQKHLFPQNEADVEVITLD